MFGFQSLDVYRCAVQFLALAMNRAAILDAIEVLEFGRRTRATPTA